MRLLLLAFGDTLPADNPPVPVVDAITQPANEVGGQGQTGARWVGQAISGEALTPARWGAVVLEYVDVDPRPFYGDASPWRGLWS